MATIETPFVTGVHWSGDTSKGKCSQAAIFARKADFPRPEMKYEKEINLGSFQWASVDQGPWKCKHAITIPKESLNSRSHCNTLKFSSGAIGAVLVPTRWNRTVRTISFVPVRYKN